MPHHRIERLGPAVVIFAELRVGVTVGEALAVFLPKQPKRYRTTPQFLMDLEPIGQRARGLGRRCRLRLAPRRVEE